MLTDENNASLLFNKTVVAHSMESHIISSGFE